MNLLEMESWKNAKLIQREQIIGTLDKAQVGEWKKNV